MKYLLMAVLAGLFVISPAFAERDDDERDSKSDERYEKRERDDDERSDDERAERRERKKEMGRHEKRERSQWEILKHISAAERKRLRKLHATNPEAWREEVAKIVKRIRTENKKIRAEKQELNKKIQGLVRQYRSSEDAEKKKKAMEQLQKITRKVFLAKMEKNKKRLESLEKHVKKLRQQYDFRHKNADKIIQSRLDTLTNDTKFDW
jgi:hypothetical protein